MEKFEAKMKSAGLNQAAIDAFRLNYEQLKEGATGMVSGLQFQPRTQETAMS